MAEDYTPHPLEIMELMNPTQQKREAVYCVECGEEILRGEHSYLVGDLMSNDRVHKKCHKQSNVIPLVPIGCENINVWRNPPSF